MAALAIPLITLSPDPAAAATGKVQIKVVASDTGEPLGFADVLLIPADTTQKKVGGFTDGDGRALLEAPAGAYRLQARAISYARKVVSDVRVDPARLFEVTLSLQPEALVQEEIVVEARAQQSTESAVLQQRKKAATVGDAISAEQIRKSSDKDASEVLRRVTGINVEDGKYVFVRGLGERYSSTEVDGVRLSSPEPNKRVVPLDLLPAAMVENITVQKTYSADRPAEFGGGDVQVKTRDFPGRRVIALSISAGADEGATGEQVASYQGHSGDVWANGASQRGIPAIIQDLASDKRLTPRSRFDPTVGFTADTLAMMGRSFEDTWSAQPSRALPNGNYQLLFGDEGKMFGRSLGVVLSGGYGQSYDRRYESRRIYRDEERQYDLESERATHSVQWGGKGGLSYRLAPAHSLHLRGIYTRNMDNETQAFYGYSDNQQDSLRGTRLLYVERSIYTASLEGVHEFKGLANSRFVWQGSLNGADRQQPDRRQTIYEQNFSYDDEGNAIPIWTLRNRPTDASREWGDLDESGTGINLSWSVPFRLAGQGGKVETGFGDQYKHRDWFYRRFYFTPAQGELPTAVPESLFADPEWIASTRGPQVRDFTYADDNYEGTQRQTAAYLTLESPLARRLRGIFGLRAERGLQTVRAFDLFKPTTTASYGEIDETDWLPSANLVWSVTDNTNIRAAASRTLSRPDLRELSLSRAFDDVGGVRVQGNPDLDRALIENYDLRVETFPRLNEVFAAGVFRKELYRPIEMVIRGGDEPYYEPQNSDGGFVRGLELEARTSLGRAWKGLDRLFLGANLSFVESEVRTNPGVTVLGSTIHPLQGQADELFNGSLNYLSRGGAVDLSLLLNHVGRRLEYLGLLPLEDVYEQPLTTFDMVANIRLSPAWRMKLAAKNLGDAVSRSLQGGNEVTRVAPGRSFGIQLVYGS